MMAEDEFFIAGSQYRTVNINKTRVHQLFGVEVDVIFDDVSEGRFDNAKVLIFSQSVEAKNKAQAYLQAILEGGEDYLKETIQCDNSEDFNMIIKEHDNIEQLYQIVFNYRNDLKEISVQGARNKVAMAASYINNLIKQPIILGLNKTALELKTVASDKPNQGPSNMFLKTSEDYCTELFSRGCSSVNDLSGNINRNSPFSLELDKNSDLEEDFAYRSWNDNERFSDSEMNRFNNSSDDETDRILSNPEHSSQIEKALKLGYSETQIALVLKKLNTTAMSVDPNILLSSLIKQGSEELATDSGPDVVTSLTQFEDLSLGIEEENVISLENANDSSNLRHIVIDGSNVAMSHGNKEVFSCRGIQLAVDYFKNRGHKKITVFVPSWRKESSRPDSQIKDQEIIRQLEKENLLKFTPSRRIAGRRVVCYDDRYVLDLACDQNGIVVSNDNYRDLHNEKPGYKKVAEEQLLQYVFVDDKFMPPEDPLGKHGPTLDNFLRIKPVITEPAIPCPYGKKCTYGNKCRFSHPERGNRPHRSVTDMLSEQSNQKLKDRAVKLEEKKNKELNKKKLRRTKSLMPSIAFSPERKILLKSESVCDDKTINKQPDFNKIFDERRRKALQREQSIREASPVPTFEHDSSNSNLDKNNAVDGVSQITELQTYVPNFSQSHSTTTTDTNLDTDCGHLQLAKKLSNESKQNFFDSDREKQSPVPSSFHHQTQLSPYSQQQVPFSKVISRGPTPTTNPSNVQGMLQNPVPSSPFLNPSVALPTSPYETQRQNVLVEPSGVSTSNPDIFRFQRNSPRAGFDSSQRYIDPRYTHDHMTVADTLSCPEQYVHPHHHQRTQMMRQSSFSDPQLHIPPSPNYMINPDRNNMQYHQNRSMPVQAPHMNSYQHQSNYVSHSDMYLPQSQLSNPYLRSDAYRAPEQLPHASNMWSMPSPMYQQTTPGLQSAYVPPSPSGLNRPVWQPTALALDAEIHPSDPRYSLYYNLCGIFSESKVRAVMNANPTEMDPDKLWAMLNPMYQQAAPDRLQSAYVPPSPSGLNRPVWQPTALALDAEIHPSDPRYSLYYNLCGIFPEPKVRATMNSNPTEKDYEKLCMKIVEMR